jgi:hypothetical protein
MSFSFISFNNFQASLKSYDSSLRDSSIADVYTRLQEESVRPTFSALAKTIIPHIIKSPKVVQEVVIKDSITSLFTLKESCDYIVRNQNSFQFLQITSKEKHFLKLRDDVEQMCGQCSSGAKFSIEDVEQLWHMYRNLLCD